MPKTLASIRKAKAKSKKPRLTAGKRRGKTVPVYPDPFPTPDTDERIKTSIILKRDLHVAAQGRARIQGLSYNGLINLALYQYLDSGSLPPEIQAIVTARPPRPPAQERRAADGSTPFVRPRLSEDEPAVTVTYDQARAIWEMQMRHPNDDYSKIAKRSGVTTEMVLAAEAAQDDSGYQRWVATQVESVTAEKGKPIRIKFRKTVRRG